MWPRAQTVELDLTCCGALVARFDLLVVCLSFD